ncbi:hypothetical protein EDD21DRAFT_375314 [Dissophora ornata]|nr:hypothetical protein EDD21DRAFT_375314 [Dissophora ornata]
MFGSPQDGQIMPMYPTLSALTSMNNAAGGAGGPPPPPPPPPLPPPGMPGQVGLGLSPSPPDINGAISPMTPPPPPPLLPGVMPPGVVPPMMAVAPSPIPGSSVPPVVPSTFALRAIDSCMQLNEPLASVAMQQFLPRMDHNLAFAAIRVAHEQGILSFSGKGLVSATLPGAATPLVGAATTGNTNSASGTGPGMALTPPTNSGALMGAAGVSGAVAHLLSGNGAVASTVGSSGIALASPRIQSSSSVFTPELNAAITDQLASVARRGSNFVLSPSGTGGVVASGAPLLASRWVGNSLPRQMFLDLVFDLPLLELISFLCKESKDHQGMLLIQARINSNRLALDGRMTPGPMQLLQRSPIRDMTQQDLLTRLWSRYARVG